MVTKTDDAAFKVGKVSGLLNPKANRVFSSAGDVKAVVSPKGVIRSALIREVASVEIRQSERLKLHRSGDEDVVQKAMRYAQVRNLELDPSYLTLWVLARCLGKFT